VEATLERAHELKEALVEFVLEAEGELAESLEAYAAASRVENAMIVPSRTIIDTFLTEGKVGDKTPLVFLESQPELSTAIAS